MFDGFQVVLDLPQLTSLEKIGTFIHEQSDSELVTSAKPQSADGNTTFYQVDQHTNFFNHDA